MTAVRQMPPEVAPPRLGLLLRVLPSGLYAGRSRAVILRSSIASRSVWLAIVSGFFEPLFFLVAMGQ
ncbi:MAG TPA: ABC transporter, partial [Pseudonocardiaceae bacterium]|nr:ABC transporter [Pseudonocardiaceae bacterium]